MAEYVTLLGADDVSRAGRQMQDAADRMSGAASTISESLYRHQIVLEEFIARFEQAVARLNQTESGKK